MIHSKNSKTFKWLIGFSGIVIAICAAYFSIFGLSKLFSDSRTEVIIMASALEFGKLVVVSFLYRYWKDSSKTLKTYLILAIIGLMAITSLGIYGFLTNAYQNTKTELDKNNKEVELVENKKQIFESKIDRLETELNNNNTRVSNLIELRNKQEDRVDKLLEGENYYNARRVQNSIKRSDEEINKLNDKIDGINNQIFSYQDSLSKYDMEILETTDTDVAGELGPLIYLSRITGWSMDRIINWFVLLIVIVFDPLAISLVISYNLIQKKIIEEDIPVEEDDTDLKIGDDDVSDIQEETKKSEEENPKRIEKDKKKKYNEENDVIIVDENRKEETKDIQEEEKEIKKEKEEVDEFAELEEELKKKEFYNEVSNNNKKNYSNVTKTRK